MPEHKVMDHSGHSTHAFDAGNKVEVEQALARFNELVKAGYTPAELKAGGEQTVNREFNPAADVVFYPRLVGG